MFTSLLDGERDTSGRTGAYRDHPCTYPALTAAAGCSAFLAELADGCDLCGEGSQLGLRGRDLELTLRVAQRFLGLLARLFGPALFVGKPRSIRLLLLLFRLQR